MVAAIQPPCSGDASDDSQIDGAAWFLRDHFFVCQELSRQRASKDICERSEPIGVALLRLPNPNRS